MKKRILVTGGAGFIGYHTVQRLCEEGHDVFVIDNVNDYYSQKLKWHRIENLKVAYKIKFNIIDITQDVIIDNAFHQFKPQVVIHLAAQAGVRYSEVNPQAYTQSNIVGFANILESCKRHKVEHLLYASSSSVYGNAPVPFSEANPLGTALSYYALTKQINEDMAEYFHKTTNIPVTGMRFFTAYGPAGRPDMAYWTFSKKILSGQPITLYGKGEVARDFTYCSDVVEAMVRLLVTPRTHNVINIGSNQPIKVNDLVNALEQAYGKKAIINYAELPATDPEITWCDQTKLSNTTGYYPQFQFEVGIQNFARWYVDVGCKLA